MCFWFLFVCLFVWDQISLCSLGSPRTSFVDRDGFKPTDICQPSPPEFWDKRCVPPPLGWPYLFYALTQGLSLIFSDISPQGKTIVYRIKVRRLAWPILELPLDMYSPWETMNKCTSCCVLSWDVRCWSSHKPSTIKMSKETGRPLRLSYLCWNYFSMLDEFIT